MAASHDETRCMRRSILQSVYRMQASDGPDEQGQGHAYGPMVTRANLAGHFHLGAISDGMPDGTKGPKQPSDTGAPMGMGNIVPAALGVEALDPSISNFGTLARGGERHLVPESSPSASAR